MRSLKIIIAGGGTGGHIFPAIAIANALKNLNKEVEILFVGANGKMEMEKVPQAGYQIEGITIAGLNRSSLIKNIGLPLKLIKSFLQVRKIINRFKPDAVIGVGGYSSFPVLRYAQSRGIATFIHESNSFAGKSNKLLGKRAVSVFTGSIGMEKFFPATKIVYTGNPVRSSIVSFSHPKNEALSFFSLSTERKTLLVLGGSLGAKSINEAIDANLNKLTENNLQLIWQTGKPYAEKAKQSAAGNAFVWTNEFIAKMEMAYAAADMVVARSGAMTVAELCIVKKPCILVPYPFAAEDHQTVNAMTLLNENAALIIKDAQAKENLATAIITLANDEQKQEQLKKSIGRLANVDADKRIAEYVLSYLNEKRN